MVIKLVKVYIAIKRRLSVVEAVLRRRDLGLLDKHRGKAHLVCRLQLVKRLGALRAADSVSRSSLRRPERHLAGH